MPVDLDSNEVKPPAVGGPEKQPKKRVTKAIAGREIANKVMDNPRRQVRLGAWDQIEGQYSGQDPDDQAALELEGKGHLSNFNTGALKTLIDTDVGPFFSMIVNAQRPALFDTLEGANFQRENFTSKWAARYKEMLKAWPSYNYRCAQYLLERAKFGHGPIYWPKEKSWQFKPIPSWSLLVPEGSPADPDEWTIFFVVDSVKPHDLVATLSKLAESDAKAYKVDKWNKGALGKAIKKFADDEEGNLRQLDQIGEISVHQTELRDEMLFTSFWKSFTKWDRITLVRMYVKEYSGKWSEQIFTSDGEGAFLYEDLEVYENVSDFLLTNPYEQAFSYQDIKGIGEHVSSLAIARDRSVNKYIDNSLLNSMLVIQGAAEGDEALLEQIRWEADMAYIPGGLTIQGQNMKSDSQMLGAFNVLSELVDSATRHRFAQSPQQETQSRTAKEFLGKLVEKAELSEREKDLFSYQEQMKHKNIMARMRAMITDHMVEETPEGLNIVVMERKDLDLAEKINPGFRILYQHFALAISDDRLDIPSILAVDPVSCMTEFDPTLQELIAISENVGRLGPAALENYDKMFVRRMVGPQNAERIIGRDTGPKDNTDEHEAYIEHGAFRPGYYVPVGTNDNHLVHARIHSQHATRLIARYENREGEYAEGAPLPPKIESFRELLVLWNHNMGTEDGNLGHVKIIEGIETFRQEAVELLKSWGNYFGLLEKLQAEIREQSEAEEQRAIEDARGPDPVEQEKIQTEKTKQAVLVDKHQTEKAIKIDAFQLDQRIKMLEATIKNQLARNANS